MNQKLDPKMLLEQVLASPFISELAKNVFRELIKCKPGEGVSTYAMAERLGVEPEAVYSAKCELERHLLIRERAPRSKRAEGH